MKRIVYYTDSTGFGGAENALLQLLGGLDRERFEPVLFHQDTAGVRALIEGADALGVRRVVVPPLPEGVRGLRGVPAFARRIRAERPSVFHAVLSWPLACKYGLLAAALARVPLVLAHVQLFMELPYTRSERWQRRVLAVGVNRYVGVSRHTTERMRAVFGIPRPRLRVIRNAAPVERLAAIPAFVCPRHRPPHVLTLARLEKQKGIPYLLEAAARLPDVCFAIAGDGPDRAMLRALAARLGVEDRVRFLGQRTDVPDLLADCDLFVLPSLYEGLPLTVLEAMAAGRPVVATHAGGTGEVVIDGETGLLIRPADTDALTAAIRRMLDNPALAARLAAAARERVQRDFGIDVMVRRFEALYDGDDDDDGD